MKPKKEKNISPVPGIAPGKTLTGIFTIPKRNFEYGYYGKNEYDRGKQGIFPKSV